MLCFAWFWAITLQVLMWIRRNTLLYTLYAHYAHNSLWHFPQEGRYIWMGKSRDPKIHSIRSSKGATDVPIYWEAALLTSLGKGRIPIKETGG